jgi:serine/threonine protein kinase
MDFKRLGKYEIVAKIGQGAMGEVFRAHDPVLGRDVAIKTMSAGVGADDELRKRFHREAQSAARLNHPNIITVHDFGEEQGHIYMAMELLEGDDLKDLITRQSPLSLQQKLSLMEQICDGLAFAHARDVVHRDLKPANIHILPGGQVKIMDFGLARISSSDMTRAGVIMGTPNYMSPEQVRGEKATAGSDVFSLGAVFYELLGGRKPFDADSLAAILYQVMQVQPEPLAEMRPDLPPELCRVIGRAMAKDGRQRYANGGELREAFREIHSVVVGARTAEGLQAPFDPGRTLKARTESSAPGTLPLPRAAPELADVTRVSRDATALQPVSAYPETLVERQSTLSGKASTQVPPSAKRRPPPAERTELLEVAPPARPRRASRGLLYGGGALAAAAGLGALAFVARQGVQPSPGPAPPPSTAAHASPSVAPPVPLEGMRTSLRDKDYRTAASQAREVLRLDPQNDEAKQAADEAERALREIGVAAARVREALDAGHTDRASGALASLAALDPRGDDTAALTTRLADANRVRVQESRSSMEAARRDATGRGATAADMSAAETVAAAAEGVLRQGDLTAAARGFAQARDAFQRAQRSPVAPPPPVIHPVATPTPVLVADIPFPTLPPVPASTLPAAAPQLSDAATKQAIRGVLDEYRQSFESRNADTLRTVQPTVDYETIKQTFAAVTAFGVRLEVESVTVTGTTAAAKCLVTYSPVPKPAGKSKPVPTVFHLKKTGDLWLIESLQRVEK